MRSGLLIVACLVATVLAAPPVAAHANYLSSEPPQGARLDAPPASVEVVLSEPVDPNGSGIEVLDSEGRRVDDGDVAFQSGRTPRFTVSLPPDLPAGAYTIRWWALSTVDQHTTGGTVGFAVGGFEPPEGQTTGDAQDPLAAFGRTVQYMGFALALGAAAFLLYADRSPPEAPRRRRLVNALRSGVVTAFVGVMVLTWNTIESTGLALGAFAGTTVGQWMLARCAVAATAVAFVGLATWRGGPRLDMTAAALVLAGALGSSRFGHASVYGIVAIAIDFAHLVSVAVWIGGLALLVYVVLQAGRDGYTLEEVRAVGVRFSHFALVAVVVMAITGLLLTLLILGWDGVLDPRATWATAWGKVLYAKIILAAGMVAVAGINRYVFLESPAAPKTPWMGWTQKTAAIVTKGRAGPLVTEHPRRTFGGFIAAEAVMGAMILALAGILTSLGAPYDAAAADGSSAGFRLTGMGDEFQVVMEADPSPSAGNFSDLRFLIRETASGDPVVDNTCGRDNCIRVAIAPEGEEEQGAEVRTAVAEADGWWRVDGVLFVRGGNHTLEVAIQTAYVYEDRVRFAFAVAGAD